MLRAPDRIDDAVKGRAVGNGEGAAALLLAERAKLRTGAVGALPDQWIGAVQQISSATQAWIAQGARHEKSSNYFLGAAGENPGC